MGDGSSHDAFEPNAFEPKGGAFSTGGAKGNLLYEVKVGNSVDVLAVDETIEQ